METRKIQRVSHGTLTVSLPREWATAHDLSAGDVVNIHPHLDGTLTVQPADETAHVDLSVGDDPPERLERLVRSAYTAGAVEVTVTSEGGFADGQRSAIRDAVRSLPGVTVGEESAARLTVRNVLDSREVSIRQSVRHLQFVALSRHRDATAALVDSGASVAAADGARGDRLAAMVERYFVRSLSRLDEVDELGEPRPALFALYRTADELARIAAHADRIAAVASALDGPLAPCDEGVADGVDGAATDARTAAETAVDAIFEPRTAAVWSALGTCDAVRDRLDDLERRLFESPGGDYRVGRAVAALRGTVDSAASIATVGLRRAVRDATLDADRGNEADTEP